MTRDMKNRTLAMFAAEYQAAAHDGIEMEHSHSPIGEQLHTLKCNAALVDMLHEHATGLAEDIYANACTLERLIAQANI